MPLLPVAVVTSDPRLSGLKRAQGINLTVLEIGSPKIGVPGVKIKLSAGLHSLLETQRGNLLSCLLQLLETACIPCPMALPSIFNACSGWLSLSHVSSLGLLLLPPLSIHGPL